MSTSQKPTGWFRRNFDTSNPLLLWLLGFCVLVVLGKFALLLTGTVVLIWFAGIRPLFGLVLAWSVWLLAFRGCVILGQTTSLWFRRMFGWSESWQSWKEFLSALFLFNMAFGLIWFSGYLSALTQVVLWCLWCLALAVLFRRGWRLLFGPVLFYDVIRSARRGRYVWLRCIYAGLLLFFLFVLFLNYWNDYRYSQSTGDPDFAAALAQNYFEVLMAVQLVAVLLLTPAYVAGSIADEKRRQTLEFLLATDLRSSEIVFSKLGSRLANLTLLVLTGLPILSMVQFLGGVDPNLVLAGFAVTGLTMLGLSGVSILCSAMYRRSRDAIAMTYLMVVSYIVLSLLVHLFQFALIRTTWFGTPWWTAGPSLNDIIDIFHSGNLILFLVHVNQSGIAGNLAKDLPGLLLRYASFHGIIFLVTVAYSVFRLRTIALKQFSTGKSEKRSWFGFKRKTRTVNTAPMIWKEVFCESGLSLNWLGIIIVSLLVALTFIPAVIIVSGTIYEMYTANTGGSGYVGGYGSWNWFWRELAQRMNVWVRISSCIISTLTLLAVAVRASNCISNERDKQTWDSLLTTPMSGHEMFFGKWLGNITGVRLGWCWMLGIWVVGILTGGMHPLALPLLIGAWFVYAGFLSTLGCWFSLQSRSSLRATVGTLVATTVLGVGHWLPWLCCAAVGPRGGDIQYLLKFQAGLTPPVVMAFLPFYNQDFGGSFMRKEMTELIAFSVVGIGIWLFVTITFWNATVLTFCTKTNRTDQAFGMLRVPREGYLEPRSYPPTQPTSPPAEPYRIKGATLIEESDVTEEIQPNIPEGYNFNVRLISEEWEDRDKEKKSEG